MPARGNGAPSSRAPPVTAAFPAQHVRAATDGWGRTSPDARRPYGRAALKSFEAGLRATVSACGSTAHRQELKTIAVTAAFAAQRVRVATGGRGIFFSAQAQSRPGARADPLPHEQP